MSTYVGIDLGTTATKAAVIRSDGTVLARSRAAHPNSRRAERGRADPEAWVGSVRAACRALGPAAENASAVGLAVHCPTVLLLDDNGEPLTSGLTWDHPALVEYCEQLATLRTPEEIRLIGNHVSPSTFMASAHSFFRDHEPRALDQASTMGLVGSWLGQWFTGERGLDPTQASYTGVFSCTDGTWDWLHDLNKRLGIPAGLLPPIRPTLSVLGELQGAVARSLNLPVGIPVIVGSADTPAASYLLGSEPGGPPLFIMGTTHVISNCIAHSDDRAQALQRADVRSGQWLINGVTNGGDALAIGAKLLGYGSSGGSVQSLIEDAWTATPKDALAAPVFIPHVVPERGPLWFKEPRTALIGVVAGTSSEAAARGVLEGVLFADRMIIENCVPEGQGPILLSGAFGTDVMLPQILADVLQSQIHVVDEGHLPSIGAAAFCVEVLEGTRVPAPTARPVNPRKLWAEAIDQRWSEYQEMWKTVVGREPLSPFTPGSAKSCSI